MGEEQSALAASTAEAKPKKQKKRVRINRGISGVGTDYTVYILNSTEKFYAIVLGFCAGFGAAYIYFNNKILGMIVGVIAAWKGIDVYRKMLFDRRQKDLRLQFRDMLESLSNSYTVGMTASRAFQAAYQDMVTEHGDKSYIVKEIALINSMYENQGVEINEMLIDFGERSGIDDIKSFASVFDVSTQLAGDIAKVVRETRDMIGDKIEIEMEIQTMVSGKKGELKILAVMPLVMSLLTRSFGTGGAPSMLEYIIKFVALGVFVFAYWLGTRIVDIKV